MVRDEEACVGSPTERSTHQTGATRFVLSIRWVVSLASVLLTSVVVLCVGIVAERSTRRIMVEEWVARLCAESRHLGLISVSAMLTPYPELTLHPLLVTLRQQQPELELAAVCDQAGIIRGDA